MESIMEDNNLEQVVDEQAPDSPVEQVEGGDLDSPSTEIPDTAGTPEEMQASEILNEKPETEEEEIQEEQQEEVPEQSVMEIAKEIYPDREFQSEGEAIQAVKEHVEAAKEYEQKTKEANKTLVNIFNNNQELVALVRMLNSGASFTEALPHVIDVDALLPKEGDPDWEAWQKAKEDGAKTRAEREAAQKQIAENLEMSMADIDNFAKENDMSPEEANEFLTAIDSILENVSQGKVTRDILDKFKKGLFHEKIVKEESEKSEIRGRNEAIEEKVQKESKDKGDGLPEVKSSATEEDIPEQKSDPSEILGKSIDDYTSQRRRF